MINSGKTIREGQRDRMREIRARQADIGDIPECENWERRQSCKEDLRKFCETYRPDVFTFEWSEDHLKVLQLTEETVLRGGLYAVAMPRGNGKTTISITAAMWALLYGHRQFVCLVGATAGKAEDLLKSIKTELRFNPQLNEDFPEVCYPISQLEGRATRANGQTTNGVPTNMQWLADKLVFPSIEGSKSSGSIISVAGVTGDIRGQQHTLPEGGIIRPDMCIVDDPQTRESASSPSQTESRLRIIQGDILGLSGPAKKISCIMPCTVIKKYDLADRLLKREEFLDWKATKTQMLYGKPEHPEMWEKYRELRDEALRNDLDADLYSNFYLENREIMDKGLTAGWKHRYTDDEHSAIQHAMNLQFRDWEAYQAEYQNEPSEDDDSDSLKAEFLLDNMHHCEPGLVPLDVQRIVAFADVQKECLYWMVVGFTDSFTGYIIDYGQWPEQKDKNINLRNLRTTLTKLYPNTTLEHRLREAMTGLSKSILDVNFKREDNVELAVSRLMIDANWGQTRDVVYNWCRTCEWKAYVLPSHGRGIGASSQPLNHGKSKKSGAKIGSHWRIETSKEMPIRYCIYDANLWKSYTAARLKCPAGTEGSISIPKQNPREHKALIDNLTAEYPVRVEGRGRTVEEWKLKPGVDNHWWDCVVGCCVAANIEGIKMRGEKKVKQQEQKAPRSPRKAVLL